MLVKDDTISLDANPASFGTMLDDRQSFEVGLRDVPDLALSLVDRLTRVLLPGRPMPHRVPDVLPVPEKGLGLGAIDELWTTVVDGSTMLASPGMIGHMNTAPHVVTALTDALVSQLNNNLIFHELSPFASRVEEVVIREFALRLGLPADTAGTFCSGGSIANLTAVFAAVGGFTNPLDRAETAFFVGESAHSSVPKAASIVGIPKENVISIPADDQGHLDPEALRSALAMRARRHNVVVATLGTTLHGAIDDIPVIADICRQYGAWLHVDAVFGGNLAFSRNHRHFLKGLRHADSISLAPQKWMYVPRLSAIVLILRPRAFDPGLEWPMPYSVSDDRHRGRWGLQASRRADAVTLWVFLQLVGAERVGEWVDGSIALTRHFYDMLEQHADTFPIHRPDLALQLFRIGSPDGANERARRLQQKLAVDGRYWLSLATWREEVVVRAALLNRSTRIDHLTELLSLLGDALS